MKRFATATFLSLSSFAAVLPPGSQAQTAPGDDAPAITIARQGSQPPQPGPADRFTGSVSVEPVFAAKAPSRVSGGSVTFQSGARSAWHTHPLGQVLFITAGEGWVQKAGAAPSRRCTRATWCASRPT